MGKAKQTINHTDLIYYLDERQAMSADGRYYLKEFITAEFDPAQMPRGLYNMLLSEPQDKPITEKVKLSLIRSYFGTGPMISACDSIPGKILDLLRDKEEALKLCVEFGMLPSFPFTVQQWKDYNSDGKKNGPGFIEAAKNLCTNEEYEARLEEKKTKRASEIKNVHVAIDPAMLNPFLPVTETTTFRTTTT